MRFAGWATDFIQPVDRAFESELNAKQARQLAEGTFEPAFGTGTVIADDVDHEGVIELAGGLQTR